MCSSHGRSDDVSVMIIDRCDDGRCEVNVMIITMVSDHIFGSHIGHSDDGPGDDHKCDDDVCGWSENVMMANVMMF